MKTGLNKGRFLYANKEDNLKNSCHLLSTYVIMTIGNADK